MDRIMKTFEQHDKKLRFLVKYENLRYNTLEELKKIYQFIGIEIDNGELEKIVNQYSFEKIPAELKGKNKVTRSASPGKWKENFSKEEQDLVNSIIDETLNKLGY